MPQFRNIIRTLIKALLESNPVEFKQNVVGYAAVVKLYTCVHAAPISPSKSSFVTKALLDSKRFFWQLFGVGHPVQAQPPCAFSKFGRYTEGCRLLVCAGMPSGLPPVILSVVEGLSWCTVKKASERKTLVSDEGIAK
jgi:hypothetical protein